jgi:hypothetical protein
MIRIITPRKMRWAGRIAHIGHKIIAYVNFVEKPEGEEVGVGIEIKMAQILHKEDGGVCTRFLRLRTGTSGALL